VAVSSGADRCGDELREAGVAVSLGADVNAVAVGADVVGAATAACACGDCWR
jgi:Zn-dependent alcohol dehydrogenase